MIVDPRLSKWVKWESNIQEIHKGTRTLFSNYCLYDAIKLMYQTNSSLREVGYTFFECYEIMFYEHVIIRIRRETDKQRNARSFYNLLNDLSKNTSILNGINVSNVEQDQAALLNDVKAVRDYANQFMAHRQIPDKQVLRRDVKIALTTLFRLVNKYYQIITRTNIPDHPHDEIEDWTKPFRFAWITDDFRIPKNHWSK